MSDTTKRLARALNLRGGEGHTLVIMALFLFLNTATTTVLSAAKNGLFLSVYPGEKIPQAIIAAALVTAVVAVIFAGVIAGTARRSLAVGLTVVLGLSLLGSRTAFELNPANGFAVYLWLSAVQVLVMTHAWDYVSDLLTGRQAKRLLPLIGMGASVGAILGGVSIAPLVARIGTADLLVVAVLLLVGALPLLWAVREPAREPEEGAVDMGALRGFFAGASRGFRTLGNEKLLRLLAFGLIALTLTGTLIDLQLKLVLQETFERDRITAIYGLVSAGVGTGTLLLQFWAARVLFPKLGVSFAALLQGGVLTFAAGGIVVTGGWIALIVAQALDDILQFSVQKPVEQISLLPFPGPAKSAALATLSGVLRPLSKAAAGAVALALVTRPDWLPLVTVASAVIAFVTFTRHRPIYLQALESALARHAVDFTMQVDSPLVVDAGALSVIDRGLQDRDPTVVVFATSLLEQLPAADALPRAVRLLEHGVSEVRAEAAGVVGRIDAPPDSDAGAAVSSRLAAEDSPFVLASLLQTIGQVGGVESSILVPHLTHEDSAVRRAALVALGRLDWPDTRSHVSSLLASERSTDRLVGSGAVGDLGLLELVDELTASVEDPLARPAALDALVALGRPAVPVMTALLDRRELPLPLRRSVITALASVEGREARDALIGLVEEPALGPAALTSLRRMRNADRIDPIDPPVLRPILGTEMRKGLRFSLAASAIRAEADQQRNAFVAAELEGLRTRSVHRALRILALSYDASRLGAVATGLLSDDVARRSNALELLEGTISGQSSAEAMPFMEVTADGFAADRVAELLDDAADLLEHPAETLSKESDWWPRSLGLHMLGRDAEISTPGQGPNVHAEDTDMIPLIEKVMILKGSQLFQNFPGPDLAGIAALAEVVHLEKDDIVFQQGDEGDAFYMVVKGAVRISRGTHELALLSSREGFGEMAILDQETRSATATAAEATTLLRIDRDSFDRLIEQNPSVARGIYRMLNERLRNTLAQVASG